jgi:very-short-patch-repair endonuclease
MKLKDLNPKLLMAYLGKSKENSYFYNSSKASFNDAKELRSNQTEAEALLWEVLRNRQINGLKFRRQHPVCSFIVDFYCNEAHLIIELDGSIHDEPKTLERDKMRTDVFIEKGLKVIRFKNEDVMNDLNYVIHKIINAIN